MNRIPYILIAVGLALTPTAATATPHLADVFGADMILQRDMPVPVWGHAKVGEVITVSFAGHNRTTKASADGTWLVRLPVMKASGKGRTLTVRGSGKPVEIKGVLVGELWLALMSLPPRLHFGESPAPYPCSRVVQIGNKNSHSNVPKRSLGRRADWTDQHDILTTAMSNRLHEQLGVPIGILRVWVGDLEAATPLAGLRAVPTLHSIADRAETWDPATPRGAKAYAAWAADTHAWAKTLSKNLDAGNAVPSQPPATPGPVVGDHTEPTVIYNGNIHPLTPMAVRGIIHTHAFANVGDRQYVAKLRALIAGLRVTFDNCKLPVCLVQLGQPHLYYLETLGSDVDINAWAGHRDRQRQALAIDNTGLVVSADVDSHPIDVGSRIARWAMSAVYRRNNNGLGPIYRRHTVRGNEVVVEFNHADRGLTAAHKRPGAEPATRKDGRLSFFAVAGADRIFRRATARIDGNRVVVSSPKVAKPVAVRYAYQSSIRGLSLYNGKGLPATPFRSDDWDSTSFDALYAAYAGKPPAELIGLLGYPGEAAPRAAAKALAAAAGAGASSVIEKLLIDTNPDLRCGGLRALGYLHTVGPVDKRSYRGDKSQTVTPAIRAATERISALACDPDFRVRACAAEALGLIGAEDDATVDLLKTLVVDDEAFVRCAVLNICKFRLKTQATNLAVAQAALAAKATEDATTDEWAFALINRYFHWEDAAVDRDLLAKYLLGLQPGQMGRGIQSLGNTIRRMDILNDPKILPGVLNVYSLGCRQWMLYGVERWIANKQNRPIFADHIKRWKAAAAKLRKSKPAGYQDRARRYDMAVDGLERLIRKSKRN